MIWDSIKKIIRNKDSKPDKKEWLSKLIENLEDQWLKDVNLPFKIVELKNSGFLVKVSGLLAYISFNHMPWIHEGTNYWTAISPKLIGKVFFCKIHSISKTPFLSIIINGEIPQLRKNELIIGEKYRGIIIEKMKNGIIIEIGCHFNWKCGSYIGYLHESNFEYPQSFPLCSVGDEIEIFYQGANGKGRMAFTQNNDMVDWLKQIPQGLVGQIVLAHAVRVNETEVKFLVEGKYSGKIYYQKNDSFFGSKRMGRKIKNKLKDGDIIHCEVIGFREKPRILKLKWIAELDSEIIENEYSVFISSQDKSDEDKSKVKGRAKYEKIPVKNDIMNNLDNDTVQKMIANRDKN